MEESDILIGFEGVTKLFSRDKVDTHALRRIDMKMNLCLGV